MNEHEKINAAVKKYMDGDKKAFTEIYELTYQATYYYILGSVKNPDAAEDIISDTYLQVVKSIGTLSSPEAFVSWLRTIAHSKICRYFKKNGREVLVTEEEEPIFDTLENENEEFIPAVALEKESDRNEIIRIINGLSDVQKQTVFMHYFDKMPVAKIAEAMECSENTVKSRLNYARKALKEMFVEEEKKGNKFYSVAPFMFMLFSQEVQTVGVSPDVTRRIIEFAEVGTATAAAGSGIIGTIKNFFSTAAGKVTAASTAAKAGMGVGAAAVVAVACIVPAAISDEYVEDLSMYAIGINYSGEVSIDRYLGDEKNIIIPSQTEDGLPITKISGKAFYETGIENIIIPDTITEIDTAAFMDCQSLKIVKMGDNVEEIAGEAFKNCTSLEEIELSEKLESIRWEVFKDCTSLKSIILPDNVTYIAGYAFGGCTSLENIEIGEKISYIAYVAFENTPIQEYISNEYEEVISDTMVWGDMG